MHPANKKVAREGKKVSGGFKGLRGPGFRRWVRMFVTA